MTKPQIPITKLFVFFRILKVRIWLGIGHWDLGFHNKNSPLLEGSFVKILLKNYRQEILDAVQTPLVAVPE